MLDDIIAFSRALNARLAADLGEEVAGSIEVEVSSAVRARACACVRVYVCVLQHACMMMSCCVSRHSARARMRLSVHGVATG